ncbi:hypothetical protein [Kushneria phosphatilytica]|uniref:Uncharacterized protein n=1 Tax=Kushneria phosphatilytica TaxID=657387 RepID=A0A1S1NZH0_9GAMM|nr:hypothetical protein [Kushneria phosphatilytica]OHV11185.1 hypothetical protein BH688_07620 [Kushneria phosphatilytica]QEL12247.1 hypothetical protein FY550_14615 [Kushneria phosphatilytica]
MSRFIDILALSIAILALVVSIYQSRQNNYFQRLEFYQNIGIKQSEIEIKNSDLVDVREQIESKLLGYREMACKDEQREMVGLWLKRFRRLYESTVSNGRLQKTKEGYKEIRDSVDVEKLLALNEQVESLRVSVTKILHSSKAFQRSLVPLGDYIRSACLYDK